MKIDVRFDVRQIKHMLQDIPSNVVPVAVARALNKTVQAAKSAATQSIAANMGVKQQEVRPLLAITRANANHLTAILSANYKRRMTLIKLDPRATQDSAGVIYRGQDGQTRHIEHAFIATMRNGHRGVYARKPGAKRLPIRELQGPSVQKVFLNQAIQAAMKAAIDERWKPNLEHEIAFELQRRGYSK